MFLINLKLFLKTPVHNLWYYYKLFTITIVVMSWVCTERATCPLRDSSDPVPWLIGHPGFVPLLSPGRTSFIARRSTCSRHSPTENVTAPDSKQRQLITERPIGSLTPCFSLKATSKYTSNESTFKAWGLDQMSIVFTGLCTIFPQIFLSSHPTLIQWLLLIS